MVQKTKVRIAAVFSVIAGVWVVLAVSPAQAFTRSPLNTWSSLKQKNTVTKKVATPAATKDAIRSGNVVGTTSEGLVVKEEIDSSDISKKKLLFVRDGTPLRTYTVPATSTFFIWKDGLIGVDTEQRQLFLLDRLDQPGGESDFKVMNAVTGLEVTGAVEGSPVPDPPGAPVNSVLR